MRSVLRAAAIEAGIPDDSVTDMSNQQDPEDSNCEDTVHGVAVPEESAPGESQSNGAAERAVQMIEDQIRVMNLSLEHKRGVKVPVEHPLMWWLVEHSAMLLTNVHVTGDDRLTGYHRLHGHSAAQRMPEFGEMSMWFVPKRLRHKLDPR